VGQVIERRPVKLARFAADESRECLVGMQAAATLRAAQADQRNADRCVLERGLEPPLGLVARSLRTAKSVTSRATAMKPLTSSPSPRTAVAVNDTVSRCPSAWM